MLKTLAIVGIAACVAQGQVIWDETIDGDLSNDGATPSVGGSLAVGDNLVRGSTGPGTGTIGEPGFDVLTFTVDAGEVVTSMILNAYDPATGGSSGFVLFDGPLGDGTGTPFIGGSTGDGAAVGTDLFDQIGITELVAGDYTFEVREFGGPRSTWEVNFTVVPAPASAALLGLGGLAAIRRRR